MPGNPKYAIGAVAADGTVWRDAAAVASTGATEEYFDRARRETAEAARETAGDGGAQPLAGMSVVLVDDRVATGSTARACLNLIRTHSPERVVLAIPVGSLETVADRATVADEVACLETPPGFRGVAQFYDNFEQVTVEYLDR